MVDRRNLEIIEELKKLAKSLKEDLNLKFNEESVEYLEGFIERTKTGLNEEQINGLVTTIGAFLGECIIKNYGGYWDTDANGYWCVKFDEKNMVYPFSRVRKQFDHGLEDSISSFYTVIPIVFKFKKKLKK